MLEPSAQDELEKADLLAKAEPPAPDAQNRRREVTVKLRLAMYEPLEEMYREANGHANYPIEVFLSELLDNFAVDQIQKRRLRVMVNTPASDEPKSKTRFVNRDFHQLRTALALRK